MFTSDDDDDGGGGDDDNDDADSDTEMLKLLEWWPRVWPQSTASGAIEQMVDEFPMGPKVSSRRPRWWKKEDGRRKLQGFRLRAVPVAAKTKACVHLAQAGRGSNNTAHHPNDGHQIFPPCYGHAPNS